MDESKKIEFLVADTAAFIQNKALQDLAEHVITCEKVINEVRNKRQLKRLAVLPYDLEVKDVFPENIKFVHDIAKQTGDYRSLSATDIEVIALTYQLEKEKVGTEHLKTKVVMHKPISLINHTTVDVKNIAGFYLPETDSIEGEDLAVQLEQLKCDENHMLESKGTINSDGETADLTDSELSEDRLGIGNGDVEKQTPIAVGDLSSQDSPTDFGEKPKDDNVDAVKTTVDDEESDSDEESSDEGDDDEEGWITPANVKQAKIDMDQLDYEDENAKVACITTDFAMQNVLMQIGLKVASLDGRIIKQIRTYIFRCYGCFKTTDDMTKVFCPSCGHNTLKRVSVTLEPDGTQKIHINVKRPLTMRGRRFKLPLFKGGKHSNNPIVTADQRVPDQKPTRVARTKTNILESDFIEGYSPFAVRDTTSRSAVLGIREQKQMRRPNLYRPRIGKKK